LKGLGSLREIFIDYIRWSLVMIEQETWYLLERSRKRIVEDIIDGLLILEYEVIDDNAKLSPDGELPFMEPQLNSSGKDRRCPANSCFISSFDIHPGVLIFAPWYMDPQRVLSSAKPYSQVNRRSGFPNAWNLVIN
jgi:hypothetical protein